MKTWTFVLLLMVAVSVQTARAQVIDPVVPVDPAVVTDAPLVKVTAPEEVPPNPDQPGILVCMNPVTAGSKKFDILVADRETKTVAVTRQSKGMIAYQPIHTIAGFNKNGTCLEYALTQKTRSGEMKEIILEVDLETNSAALNPGSPETEKVFSTCKYFAPGEYLKIGQWVRSQF